MQTQTALGFRRLVPRGDGLRLFTQTACGCTLRNNHGYDIFKGGFESSFYAHPGLNVASKY